MSKRTALVTGAAGFIGSRLCDRLVEMGWRVIGVDSFEDYYPREYKESNIALLRRRESFELVEASILSRSDGAEACVDRLVEGVDTVFHLAAQAGVRSSWGADFRVYSDNNILGTQMMLEACRRAEVGRFVYASSSSVYGDTDQLPMSEDARCRPYSPYGVSKLAAEQLCHLYWRNMGVPTVSLRFFTVYGARQRPDMGFHKFMRAIMDGRPMSMYGDGLQTRDFTHVSDIVAGIVSAGAAPPGSVMNLAGGSRVTLLEALDTLGEATGHAVELDMRDRQAGDVTHTWGMISAAEELIGYSPQTSLLEGLREQWAWLQELSATPGFPWGVDAD